MLRFQAKKRRENYGDLTKLADVTDSKFVVSKDMRVQVSQSLKLKDLKKK